VSIAAAAPPPSSSATSPLVEAILSGRAPAPVRLAAARGALPVTRPERLLLCVHLRGDADATVREAAEQRLAGEGRTDLAASLEAGEPLAPAVLEHFARCADIDPRVLEKLAIDPALSNAALEKMADCPHPSVLERIVINQTRLLADPEIVRRLEANPKLSATGRRLLGEFRHDFREGQSQEIILDRPQESAAEAEAAALAAVEAAAAAAAAEPDAEGPPPELLPEEAANEVFKAAYVRIMSLSVPQKIMLTIKATREERAILVRDSNKMVASSVLKSPKISDQEVEQIANMRNVSEEVLRIVGHHKHWTRSYSVMFALCRNPKTPIGVSLPFLNRLNIRDLKNLLTDKNVSEAVRRLVKKTFELRNQAAQPSKKK
jgi:hypothetical protein